MTEFEEITFKKIIKGKLVEQIYSNLNVCLGNNRISNAEISKKIGWDPAGYNQKLNRMSDLRISTFVSLCVAMIDISAAHLGETLSDYEMYEELDITRLITYEEFKLGRLFLHISAVAEGEEEFLNTPARIKAYKSLKPHVMGKTRQPRFTEKEKAAYMKYYNACGE